MEQSRKGAVLIDIRPQNEFARRHIAGARCVPVAQMQSENAPEPPQEAVVFYCTGGVRTRQNAAVLAAYARGGEAYLLAGGLNNWQRAGLPLAGSHAAGLDIMRQTQIAAGSLIVLGGVLGFAVSPWFFGLCLFVGAGLLLAGLTGFCGMAKLLERMPWNRVRPWQNP